MMSIALSNNDRAVIVIIHPNNLQRDTLGKDDAFT